MAAQFHRRDLEIVGGEPGEVLGGLTVACGEGAVEVLEVQRAGSRAMPATEALRGWDPGERFG